MELLATYQNADVIDCFRFVFDQQTPDGLNRMLAMSADGYEVNQWIADRYDPDGENAHLGQRILLGAIGARALDGFFTRLSIPDNWEPVWEAGQQLRQQLKDGHE